MLSTQAPGFNGADGVGRCWVTQVAVYLKEGRGFRAAPSFLAARARPVA